MSIVNLNGEVWEEVDGQPDYFISNKGRLKSHRRLNAKLLTPDQNIKGYLEARFKREGQVSRVFVARLVAKAFLPDWDESLQVDHINGDRTNNSVENLRMSTTKENNRGYQKVRGKSKFRGVSWAAHRNGRTGAWKAAIRDNNKQLYLGRFKDEEDAARAYNKKAIELGYAKEALNVI